MRKIQKKYLRAAREKGLSHVPPHRPGVRLDRSGRVRNPQTGEKPPGTPVSRFVAGQERRKPDGERRDGQKEEKQRFFSGFRGISARIYFEAGISVAVTLARNGGQRRRKTASFGGFGGS